MIRGTVLSSIFLFFVLLAVSSPLTAIEIGVEIHSNNIHIPWDQQAASPATLAEYPATNIFLGGTTWFALPLGENADMKVSYDCDPLLRNIATATVQFERGPARISVGPFVGFLNSAGVPFSSGLTASIRLQWPGVAYFSLRSDGGLSVSLIQMSTDPQAQSEIAAGFYVRNAIVSFVVAAKRFNELDASGKLITDAWSRYALTIDIFKKNVPYTLLASVGYETRGKRFEASGLTDSLGAIVIGTRATAQILPGIKLTCDLWSGVFTFGQDNLMGKSPPDGSLMFNAGLGVILDYDSLRAGVKQRAAAKALAAAEREAAKKAEPAPSDPAASPGTVTPTAAPVVPTSP